MTSTDTPVAADVATYDLQSNIGYLLRRAHQVGSASFLHADDTGLSVIQFATLASLIRSGPDSQNSLGRSVGSDAATMTGVVQRLKRRGFVEIHAAETDRRMKTISITEEGREIFERGARASQTSSAELLEPFSPGERIMLIEMLQRIIRAEEARAAQK